MTRSVYVAGIGRGDGRQVVELGVMELLTRQVDRVGVYRPLVHEGPDQVLGLLRARYRLAQPPGSAHGMSYAEAAALLAERGTDELVTRLVDRFHEVARAYEAVLVLGTDYADTQLPAELSLNARLANEFGASVLPVVGGAGQSAESVAAEVRNARRAYASLGCEVIATIANRVAPEERPQAAALLGPGRTGQGHAAPGLRPGPAPERASGPGRGPAPGATAATGAETTDGSSGAGPQGTPDDAAAAGAIPGQGPDPDSAPDVAPGSAPERGPGHGPGGAGAAATEAAAELAFVVPEDAALSAPTVAQMVEALGAEALLGDGAGLARDIRGFVFGGAMLPTFLTALTDGCLVITPGDREDLVVGALAAHSAGAPPIAGLLLTLGQRPGPETMALAARLAPGTPVLSVAGDSFSTATALSGLEGRLTAATPRKAEIALGLFERHVDTAALTRRLSVARGDRVTPMMFEHALIARARAGRRHVVLPEGTEERVLRAAEVLLRRDVCGLTLLGEEDAVRKRAADLGLDLGLDRPGGVRIVDPQTSPLRETFAERYAALRAHRGVTHELAYDVVADVSYFGTLMVEGGLADGMVSGAAHSTAATIRPAFEVIRTRPGASIVSSVFFMCLADRVLVYGDCAVNPDPNAEQLADIAVQSAATAARFGVEPRVAMLSYSTGTSGSGADVDKVREATELVRRLRPDLMVEGPIQYDAAVEPSVAATKLPCSQVAGRASVLVFPDLNTGNNTYKAVQRSAGAVAVGPVLQGLRKPVNDLSRGALVQDIVNTVAITAIQAQDVEQDVEKETR
ncbi:phosphate acetyltransferase [Streptomyces sp. 6N223]|uniref:phosphate acetyltransferase n=1 Tax=Streptomyces sp. 6N223 TaxID=3457412 RepID=UPI003FCFF7E5